MQQLVRRIAKSACPHDCPSACALEVPVLPDGRIGRITGARDNSYTLGVVCAKVARYAERIEHPDRLLQPLRRKGPKGAGQFEPIGWDAALDEIAENFTRIARRSGSEAIWPYHSGGNMGILQRYGLDRLRNVMRYSRQQTTICVTPAESGWLAGVGKLIGPDPREMEDADLIVVWGANPVSTQVNVMTHVARARKKRGTRLVVVDVYRTPTVEQADLALVLKPGSDAALALAVMNVLLTEGMVDRDYLARLTDFDAETERHILTRTPQWAAEITGLAADDIVAFARLYGSTRKSFIRAGFGFTRTRNGASAMHAVSCLPAMTGAWAEKGGGAFFLTYDKKYLGHRHDAAARPGRARPLRAHARPVAHRRGAGGRARGAARRPAGRGHADAERQLGDGGAGHGQGAARARPGGSVPRRAGAVHDADRPLRRHPAARHHVRRARRHVLRPRPHAPDLRPQAGGAARAGAPQQLRGAQSWGAGWAPRTRASR